MKRFTYLLLLQFFALTLSAQSNPDPAESPITDSGRSLFADPNKVYNTFDIQRPPTYPGGEGELTQFLTTTLVCPAKARKHDVKGVAALRFIVNEDGSISDAEIVRDPGYGCGDEALRVVALMPAWNPGLYMEQPVKTYYTLPVRFTCDK